MHRSSESIAALAAALAKAQMALTNPEKSLTGTVPSNRYDEPGRTFRYAPLSSGLDIVRKALGEQGIATLQTTTIDQDIQSVSLTTVLAHASGEWIASDWPVCTLSDMAAPRRMGAALTYARRYALFTLVGIAGEDDLDAPDLGGQPEGTGKAGNGPDAKHRNGNGADQPLGRFAASRKPWSPPKQPLEPEKSAALRDRLLGEIGVSCHPGAMRLPGPRRPCPPRTPSPRPIAGLWRLRSRHDWLSWRTTIALTLLHSRARPRSRPQGVDSGNPSPLISPVQSEDFAGSSGRRAGQQCGGWHIDKGALTLSEPRRYRDRAHLRFVSAQPCLICGRRPSDAHHLRFAQPRAIGRRVSDEFAVPLCRSHHRALHRHGDEAAWWKTNKVDPVVVAWDLWQRTRLDGPGGGRIEALQSIGIESPDAARNVGSDQTAPGAVGQ